MRLTGTLFVVLPLALVISCTDDADRPHATDYAGDCVAELMFDGRTYDANTNRSSNFAQPIARSIGLGDWMDCDEKPTGETTKVFKLSGVDPTLAVAVPARHSKGGKPQFAVLTPP